MAAICDHIEEGFIIYSDSWNDYKTEELEQARYEHVKVNYRYHFVDPETGVHTQNVERMWGSAKWHNKRHCGTARHHLDSCLAEFMCQQQVNGDNALNALLDAIKTYWPPEDIEY